jgi:ribosomal protein S12 methylthiotransferase accessory factor
MQVFGQTLSLKKTFENGTHRACSPAQTVERFWPLAKHMGITRLANITGLDYVGMPVWLAVRPNSSGLSTSQGKGLSDDAAKASALMESIECWHAENIDQPCRFDSAAALEKKVKIVDIGQLNYYQTTPPRPDLPMPWLEGYDLIKQQQSWVPHECVSTNYVASARLGTDNCFVQSSNGLAGGNHMLECIAHALLELIERDAVSQTEQDMQVLKTERLIKPETVTEPNCQEALKLLDDANISYVLFNLTCDIDVPVYGCSIIDKKDQVGWRTMPIFNGYGAHLSPDIALFRAISEAVQSRLTHISGSRDDIIKSEYDRGGNQDDLNNFRTLIKTNSAKIDFSHLKNFATDSFEDDITYMLDALKATGLSSAIVVNLTKGEFNIPVVKVIVPGLMAPVGMMRTNRVKRPDRVRLKKMELSA